MSGVIFSCLLLVLAWTFIQGDNVGRPMFHPPLAGDAMSSICSNFTSGNWQQQEFYSPGYPAQYPNKTNCITLLIAPKGHRIRLDFRDEFQIEKSVDCKYDYVEFRDGPFGYSPLIGRFCGSQHPLMMESSTRFIWVHFVSDDSIEYKGFRVVYDFYRPGEESGTGVIDPAAESSGPWDYSIGPHEVCRIVVDVSKHEGFLSHEDIPAVIADKVKAAKAPLDCTWAFYLSPEQKVTLKFEHLQTTGSSCDESFMEIYERTTAQSDRKKELCGSLPTFYRTESNHAFIRLYAKRSEFMPQFSAFFTVFVQAPCDSDMFECGDGTCINSTLECNSNDNCNYKWDEEYCETSTIIAPTREPVVVQYHTIIIGIVGGAIATIIFLAIVITCYQKRKEEKRQLHAIRQEERPSHEIEMTNLLNQSPQRVRMNAAPSGPPQHPNGPVNHIGASKPPAANHVSQPSHLKAHSQAIAGRQTALTTEAYPQPVAAEGDSNDFLDHNGGSATYRKYLDAQGSTYYDEDSRPDPSTINQIPTVATIENLPTSSKQLTPYDRTDKKPWNGGPRDRTPSPRPDVIQEEKFMFPESRVDRLRKSPLPQARRLSSDTVRSEKSDVWKPMSSADSHIKPPRQKPYEKPAVPSGSGQPAVVQWTTPRQLDHDNWHREGLGFEPVNQAATYSRSVPKPPMSQGQVPDRSQGQYPESSGPRDRMMPPAPPQRRTPILQHQSSAPTPPVVTGSPAHQRVVYSRTPPAVPRMAHNKASSTLPANPKKAQDIPPNIFYTRPNPSQGRSYERNIQRQHHPL